MHKVDVVEMGLSKLRTLDLFSGIGGFSLGLERTGGFETVAFCEIDQFCRRVLAKHWPNVPCHDDVEMLSGNDIGEIDVICGGFPCQDISVAGKGDGIDGKRSGLWREYARLIRELRPNTSSWKTFQPCLDGELDEYSETWPRSGMMRNGIAYAGRKSERRSKGTEYSLLPTLTKSETKDWSRSSVLAKMNHGGRVARRICKKSTKALSADVICGLSPSFAEWMAGFPIGWTELDHAETPSSRKSRK